MAQGTEDLANGWARVCFVISISIFIVIVIVIFIVIVVIVAVPAAGLARMSVFVSVATTAMPTMGMAMRGTRAMGVIMPMIVPIMRVSMIIPIMRMPVIMLATMHWRHLIRLQTNLPNIPRLSKTHLRPPTSNATLREPKVRLHPTLQKRRTHPGEAVVVVDLHSEHS